VAACSLRYWLAASVAPAALAMPAVAAAQARDVELPIPNVVVGSQGATVRSAPGAALDVNVDSDRAVVNWLSFSVGRDATVRFNDTRAAQGGRAAVLNRVVNIADGFAGIRASEIRGTLTAARGLSIYLVNPQGVLFGPNARVTAGSLVATTSVIEPDEFFTGGGGRGLAEVTFHDPATRGVRFDPDQLVGVTAGARLSTYSDTPGNIVLVGARVESRGTLNASGTAALVAASDATVNFDPASPLSLTINQGSPLASPMVVRGEITGGTVLLAGATRQAVRDAVLDIDARLAANGAALTDQGIVLVAGPAGGGGSPVTLSDGAGTAGSVGLRLGGTLVSVGAVDIRAAGAIGAATTGAATTVGGGDVAIRAEAGDIRLGDVTGGRVSLVASAGDIGAGTVASTSGDIGIVGGGVTLAAIDAAAGATVRGTALTLGTAEAAGAMTLDAGSGRLLVDTARTKTGDLNVAAGTIAGRSGRASLTAGRDLIASAGTATLAAASAARDLTVVADRLTAASATADGNLSLSGGDLTVTGAARGVGVRIDAARDLSLGTVSGTTIDLAASNGRIVASGLSANDRLGVGARSIDMESVRAGNASLVAALPAGASAGAGPDGNARVGSIVTGGDATVTAARLASVDGAVDVGGVYVVTGVDVALGGGVQAAGGLVRITATSGAITGTAGLALRSRATGPAIVLDAVTGIAMADTALVGGEVGSAVRNGDIGIRLTGTGAPLTLGTVDARALLGVDAAGALVSPLSLPGAVTLGRVDLARALTLAANGPLRVADIRIAGEALSLTGAGAITATGLLSATGVEVVAAGPATLAGVDAGAGLARIEAGGNLSAGAVAGGSVLATAGGNLSLARATATAGDVTLRAGGALSMGVVDAAGGATLTAAGSMNAADAIARGGALVLRSDGAIVSAGTLEATGAIGVEGATGIALASARSADGVVLRSGGGVVVGGALTSATDVTVAAAADVSLADVTAGRAADLRAGGSLLAGQVGAGTIAIAAGGDATVATIASAGASNVEAGRTLDVAQTRAGDAVLTGGSVRLGGVDAATLAITARAGNLAVERLGATGGATLTQAGDGGIAVGEARARDLLLRAAGPVRADRLVADTVRVEAGGGIGGRIGGAAIDAGELTVAGGGDAAFGPVTTARGATIRTAGQALLDAGVSIGGDLRIEAATVVLGASDARPVLQTAAGTITVAATAGSITGRSGLTLRSDRDGAGGRDLLLTGTGGLAFAPGTLVAGGPGLQSAVRVAAGSGAAIALDAVEARLLGSPGVATLDTGGAFSAASIRVRDPLGIRAGGDLTLGRASVAAGGLALEAGGTLTAATLEATGGAAVLAGNTLAIGTVDARSLDASARGGTARIVAVDARAGSATVAALGELSVGRVTASDAVALSSRQGDLSTDRIEAARGVTVSAAGRARVGTADAGGDFALTGRALAADALSAGGRLTATAGEGGLAVTAIDAGGDVVLGAGAGAIAIDRLNSRAGAVTITGGGDLGGVTGATGPAIVTAGDVRATLGGAARASSIDAGGAVAIRTGSAALGALTAGGDITVATTVGALALASASTPGTLALAGATVASVTGAVSAGASYRIDAAEITLGSADAAPRQSARDAALTARIGTVAVLGGVTLATGGATTIVATGASGAVSFAPGSTLAVGGEVGITTSGTAALGTVTAAGVRVTAADAVLARAITAPRITLSNGSAAGVTRLGDTPVGNEAEFANAQPRFDLSAAELALLRAPEVTIASGARDVMLGTLALAPDTGATRFAVTGSGRIDVLGRVTAPGSTPARTVLLGGEGEGARAATIRIAATQADGGRLLLEGATLRLSADRIGAGLDRDFLQPIGLTGASGLTPDQISRTYVARANSTLYDASAAGAPPYSDGAVLRAGTLVLSYRDYALFQNTGRAGEQRGVAIGGAGASGPTLTLASVGTTPNAFALFGTVDGIASSAAALLGPERLSTGDDVSPAASRINGCVIGSASGCLTSSIAQPTINLFDTSRAEIVRSADDLSLPFDPLIATNNEALYLDAGADAATEPAPRCEGDTPCPMP